MIFCEHQVRASRGLPLRLMAAEYERILRRRLRIVGGSPDDPALGQLLAVFRSVFEARPCSTVKHQCRQQYLRAAKCSGMLIVWSKCRVARRARGFWKSALGGCCREDRLPAGMVRNGNVQKDSVLTFTRAGNGRITAAANGTELTTGANALAVPN